MSRAREGQLHESPGAHATRGLAPKARVTHLELFCSSISPSFPRIFEEKSDTSPYNPCKGVPHPHPHPHPPPPPPPPPPPGTTVTQWEMRRSVNRILTNGVKTVSFTINQRFENRLLPSQTGIRTDGETLQKSLW